MLIDDKVVEDLLTGEMEERVERVFLPAAHARERARTMLKAESDNLIVKTIIRLFTPVHSRFTASTLSLTATILRAEVFRVESFLPPASFSWLWPSACAGP